MKIHKGDQVIMLSGKDRGKKGKVILVLQEDEKVVVEGFNLIKKHVRARKQGQKGQIINKERAVSVSSVALVCKSCGKPTRVGYKFSAIGGSASGGEGKNKVRICKKCEAEV